MPAPEEQLNPIAAKQAGHAGATVPDGADDPDRPLVGESTDPGIHQLLAQRQDAVLIGDDDMVTGLDAHLAELGYHREPASKEETDG
jgi:hypothetical protein